MKSKEHELQAACVKWFRFNYPNLQKLLFAIPNGGLRNIKVAMKLKAEGVIAGVPDLFLAVPNDMHNGLFIEMKQGKNTTTDNQNEMIELLKSQGYDVQVCNSFEVFRAVINRYLA